MNACGWRRESTSRSQIAGLEKSAAAVTAAMGRETKAASERCLEELRQQVEAWHAAREPGLVESHPPESFAEQVAIPRQELHDIVSGQSSGVSMTR